MKVVKKEKQHIREWKGSDFESDLYLNSNSYIMLVEYVNL